MYSFHYVYGHVEKLAQEILKGVASVEGVEAKLWQVCNDSFSSYKSIRSQETEFKYNPNSCKNDH